jgi:hypothetical protein
MKKTYITPELVDRGSAIERTLEKTASGDEGNQLPEFDLSL